MVSVLSRATNTAEGLVGNGRNRPSFDSGGVGAYAVTGAPLGPQSLPSRNMGVGPAAGTPGVLSGHFAAGTLAPEPLQVALSPQPLFSPGFCGDHGHGLQVTNVTRSPGFGGGISCSLRGPSPSFLPKGHPFSSVFYKYLGSGISN